ncbi:hypothetical protein Tco_0217206 [Tanacetum coccineum]
MPVSYQVCERREIEVKQPVSKNEWEKSKSLQKIVNWTDYLDMEVKGYCEHLSVQRKGISVSVNLWAASRIVLYYLKRCLGDLYKLCCKRLPALWFLKKILESAFAENL